MKKGFTLIELMVVIVLIGILATVVIVNIGEKPDWAKWRLTHTQIKQLKSDVELFRLEQNRYPEDFGEMVARGYFEDVPRDGWGKNLIYRVPGSRGAPYDI